MNALHDARDRLGRALGYEQGADGTWTGPCPTCGAPDAQVSTVGLTCEHCRPLDLEEASRRHGVTDTAAFISLVELLARPELLQPPTCVLPRLAYRGRLVIVSGPDKSGKSTLLADGAASLTRGRNFLGGPVHVLHDGRAVWVGLEEAVGDVVRRFNDLHADAQKIQLSVIQASDLLARTHELLDSWPADMVVVDCLAEYARVTMGQAPEDGDNAAWGALVRPWVALARQTEAGVVLIHHTRRSDGQFRGAGEIAAAADAIFEIEMPTKTEDPTLRRLRGRGRWPIEPFTVALVDGRYELSGGTELSLDARVLLHVENNPGTSGAAVREAVGGRTQAVLAALNRLVERGAIRKGGSEKRPAYFTADGHLDLGAA